MTIITYRDLIDRTYDDVKDFCSYSYQEVEKFVHDTLQLVCKMHEMAYIIDILPLVGTRGFSVSHTILPKWREYHV